MQKYFKIHYNSLQTFKDSILLTLGRKLVGSLRKVISSDSRNLFIPDKSVWGLEGDKVASYKLENDKLVILNVGSWNARLKGRLCTYVQAIVSMLGIPSNTTTLSAR